MNSVNVGKNEQKKTGRLLLDCVLNSNKGAAAATAAAAAVAVATVHRIRIPQLLLYKYTQKNYAKEPLIVLASLELNLVIVLIYVCTSLHAYRRIQ